MRFFNKKCTVLLSLSLILSVTGNIFCTEDNLEKYKSEIIKVEDEFCKMAEKRGVKYAFVFYAAEDAVLSRGGRIIKGKDGIKAYYDTYKFREFILKWKPDSVNVSSAGDMAWTYGRFHLRAVKMNGEVKEERGIFHTVWKKQKDGKWKYVWD